MVVPVADLLEIPHSHIYATTLFFENGEYSGFDKSDVLKTLAKPIVMIGDGATDLETKHTGCADLFIGYGGVVTRPIVRENTDWFVTDFRELM